MEVEILGIFIWWLLGPISAQQIDYRESLKTASLTPILAPFWLFKNPWAATLFGPACGAPTIFATGTWPTKTAPSFAPRSQNRTQTRYLGKGASRLSDVLTSIWHLISIKELLLVPRPNKLVDWPNRSNSLLFAVLWKLERVLWRKLLVRIEYI